MREYEDAPYIVIERHSAGVVPFLWGALLGVGVALLVAPRTGQETQEEIRRRVRGLRSTAEDRVGEVRDSVTGAVTRTRNRIQDRIDEVRETVESQADRARSAIDAGRRAARDAREELELRVAQAKDGFAAAADRDADAPPPPAGEVIVTEVVVEEVDLRPDLS